MVVLYNVSQQYKKEMKQPLRNKQYMKISLGLINQEAQMSAVVDNPAQYAEYSDLKTVFEKNDIGRIYATFENNFFKADGSMYFLPRNKESYRKNGITSEKLFAQEMLIRFVFNCGESDIKGLTIQFGECFPTRFTIVTSNGVEFPFENNSSYFETYEVFEKTESITIRVEEMNIPSNRVRIFYIKFGLGLEYDNDWILSTNLTSSLSAINESLPEVNFSATLRNDEQRFNVDNPSSEINFLESGQRMIISYGYELGNGNIEWIPLQSLLVSEWSADDSQTTIQAVDRFKNMVNNYYKGMFYQNGITLYDLAELVFEDAGINQEEYYLDSYLKKIIVHNPMPNVQHKEALQIIANAGRCIMDYDRYGKIRIYSAFIPNFETISNGAEYYSDVKSIDSREAKNIYASYSQDYWIADGNTLFVPRSGIQNTGYVSDQISDDLGKFQEPPIITRNLEAKYKCFGIKISFARNLPKKFLIRTFSDGILNDTITIKNDIVQEYELPYEFKEFDKIELEFLETSIPNNRVQINSIEFGAETDYRIVYDDLYSTPTGIQLEKVKNLKCARNIYSLSNTEEELMNDEIVYRGDNLVYFFSEACYGYSAGIVEGAGSVSIIASGAYYIELQIKEADIDSKVKVSVKGYKYNISQSLYSVSINNRGNDSEWSNPLISDFEHCKEVSEWISDYLASCIEYELDFRGDPAIDCGDTIFQENKYDDNLKVIVEEQQISFNGAIKGALRTRRKERVDRAKNGLGSLR